MIKLACKSKLFCLGYYLDVLKKGGKDAVILFGIGNTDLIILYRGNI
jgi:hypothetical protein